MDTGSNHFRKPRCRIASWFTFCKSHHAEAVFAWLDFIAPLEPGPAMGLGTIPDCTGLGTPYNSGRNAALERSHLPRDPR